MSKQPEALRLADSVCDYARLAYESERQATLRRQQTHLQCAAELRRLHALNAELLEALRAIYNRHNAETMVQARAAIAKAEAAQ